MTTVKKRKLSWYKDSFDVWFYINNEDKPISVPKSIINAIRIQARNEFKKELQLFLGLGCKINIKFKDE